LMKSVCSTVSEARAAAPGEYIIGTIRRSYLRLELRHNKSECKDADGSACSVARTPTGEDRRRSVKCFGPAPDPVMGIEAEVGE
jgi:hypothetical protein